MGKPDAGLRSPLVAALWGDDDLTPLPSGPRSRSAEEVDAVHRRRIIAAMAECLSEQGYAGTTVADIVGRAQVSRRTFYAQFDGREDCFLATYDAVSEELIAQIAREAVEAHAGAPWQEHVSAGARFYLQLLADEPGLTRVLMLDALSVGPAALHRRDAALRRFATIVEQIADAHHDDLPPDYAVDADIAYAMVGAIHELIRKAIADDRVEYLPELTGMVERLAFAVLAIGREPKDGAAVV